MGSEVRFNHVGAHFQAKSTMQTHGPIFFQVLSDFPSLRSENPKNQLLIILIDKLMNNGENPKS